MDIETSTIAPATPQADSPDGKKGLASQDDWIKSTFRTDEQQDKLLEYHNLHPKLSLSAAARALIKEEQEFNIATRASQHSGE